MAESMIQARGLTRTFSIGKQTVEAVQGVDFDVAEGELVAFLGPNGAGKSTTLRMLTTLLAPTSGTAAVAGFDVGREPGKVRQRIGFIGQGNGAGQNQRVRDELLTQGRCYGMDGADARRRADELMASLELSDLSSRTVNSLSGGQRRRLDIAMGLMHRPRLLFLDEPSTGLDPHSRANLWEHILRLRQDYGTTIFLTTHYLEEADNMAERVMVIDHGRVIADDTSEALKSKHAGDYISLTAGSEAQARLAAEAARRAISGAHSIGIESSTVSLRVDCGRAVLPRLLRALESIGVHIEAADLKRPTLDDVFLALTGRSLRESDIRQAPQAAAAA
jgi:ABC-2 type transport system ATP-binding protein